MQTIAIRLLSGLVTREDAHRWVAAIQRQVAGEFADAWNTSAVLHLLGPGETATPGTWTMDLVDRSSTDGALGSHWQDADGSVRGEVGIATSLADGVEPSSVLSHEVLEMIADAEAVICYQDGGRFLALEACDPVEASDDTYKIDGVALEDFVLPAYFRAGSSGPWDQRRMLDRALQVLPHGYQLIYDPAAGWQQITGALARPAKHTAALSSRRASRIRRSGHDPAKLVLVAA